MKGYSFFRADHLLTSALRGYAAAHGLYIETTVRPWLVDHPGYEPIIDLVSQDVIGFADPGREIPRGLRRHNGYGRLVPWRKDAASKPWRDAAEKLNQAPKLKDILRPFEISSFVISGAALHITRWMDFAPEADDVVVVYTGGVLEDNSHLTPMKQSEFYLLYEKAQEAKKS